MCGIRPIWNKTIKSCVWVNLVLLLLIILCRFTQQRILLAKQLLRLRESLRPPPDCWRKIANQYLLYRTRAIPSWHNFIVIEKLPPKKDTTKEKLASPRWPQKLFAAHALCSSFSFMSFFWFTTSGAHTHTVRGTHVHTHVCIVCTYVFTNVSIFVCIRMYILLCVHSLKGKWKSPTLVFLLADWNA